jgi:copper chaperone
MSQTTIKVTGMTCGGCAKSVERALSQKPGVSAARVSLPDNAVTVDFNPAQVQQAGLEDAIKKAGFGVG